MLRTKSPGFTLMEVMLAVSLSTILFVLIGAGLNIYSRTVSDRRADVVNAQIARSILHQMANDIRSTYYSEEAAQPTTAIDDVGDTGAGGTGTGTGTGTGADGGGTGGTGADGGGTGTTTDTTETTSTATVDLTGGTVQPTPGLYGNQFELQLDTFGRYAKPVEYDQLVMAGLNPLTANLLSEPKIITYYLRQSNPAELIGTPLESPVADAGPRMVLVRRVQSRAGAIYAAAGGARDVAIGEQLLSDQVVSISFAYFDGLAWLDEWDSSLLVGLPMAVQITITVVDEVASADLDANVLTTNNLYQLTVSLPSAELPEVTETTGL